MLIARFFTYLQGCTFKMVQKMIMLGAKNQLSFFRQTYYHFVTSKTKKEKTLAG